jgi:biotin carboxylase
MRRLLLLLPTSTYRADDFMAAAQRLDAAVTVASEEASSLAAADPSGLIALDLRDPAAAARQALAFSRRHPVDAVVGVDDLTVVAAAAIAKALGLPHNSVESVATARNKHRTREVLSRAGLPVPWFGLLSVRDDPAAAASRVPYPCVVKPLVLSASRGVIRADGEEAFGAAFRRLAAILREPEVAALGEDAARLLVESFIPGQEVALEGLLIGGKLRVLCLFDKPDQLDGPFFEETLYITPSRKPRRVQDEIGGCVARACEALGLREGPVHAELRVNQDGPWLLEVNPRSIGGRCSRVLRFGTGMSLEELILRQALRLPIASLERDPQPAGVMMVPIPRGGVLRRIGGQEEARAAPGVEELILTARTGQRLVPLPEGAPYLGFLFARGDTPGAVEASLREAHGRLEIEIDPV